MEPPWSNSFGSKFHSSLIFRIIFRESRIVNSWNSFFGPKVWSFAVSPFFAPGYTFLGRDSTGVSVKLDDGEIMKASRKSDSHLSSLQSEMGIGWWRDNGGFSQHFRFLRCPWFYTFFFWDFHDFGQDFSRSIKTSHPGVGICSRLEDVLGGPANWETHYVMSYCLWSKIRISQISHSWKCHEATEEVDILATIKFNSTRKRSSVIARFKVRPMGCNAGVLWETFSYEALNL